MNPQSPPFLNKYRAMVGSLLPEISKSLIKGKFDSARAAFEGYWDYLRGKFGRRDVGMGYLKT